MLFKTAILTQTKNRGLSPIINLEQERAIAESQAKEVADGMLQVAASSQRVYPASAQPVQVEELDSDFDDEDGDAIDEEAENDELPSLADID